MSSGFLWFAVVGMGIVVVRFSRIVELLGAGGAWGPVSVAVAIPLVSFVLWWRTRTHQPNHRTLLGRLRRNRRAVTGSAIVLALALSGIMAPVLTSHEPNAQPDIINLTHQAPSLSHPFGTDKFSRDVFSRVMYGARYTMAIAIVSVFVAMTIGTIVGLVAALGGKIVDGAIMRVVDAGLAIPRIFLLMVMVALWNDLGVFSLVAVLGLTSWFGTSRLVRAQALSVRRRDFVSAARASGVDTHRLVLRHVLPNVASPIIVNAILGLGNIVLIEAGLSYLGIGLRPPTPTWGNIIYDGYMDGALTAAPWVSTLAGTAIVVTVLGFSLLGDGLREALDPRNA